MDHDRWTGVFAQIYIAGEAVSMFAEIGDLWIFEAMSTINGVPTAITVVSLQQLNKVCVYMSIRGCRSDVIPYTVDPR